jgi:hypothetical protein
MTGNNEKAQRLGAKLEGCAERLMDFLRGELRTALKNAEDRAHIATTGDRPFLGCNPDRASLPVPQPAPAAQKGPCDPLSVT